MAWKQNQEEEYTEWEVDFLADVLELPPGSRVLDVMAGYGRHALPLARRGYELTGIDISEEYCADFQEISQAEELPVTVLCGDFMEENGTLGATYEAAYCLGNSFSFFPRTEMLVFLQKISDQLQPGGRFVAHTQMLAESVLPHFQERDWMQVGDDIQYLSHNHYDAAEGVIDAQLTYIRGSERVTRSIKQYIYSLSEMAYLMQQAGLTLTESFGSLDGDPFALGDEQAYLLARKESFE